MKVERARALESRTIMGHLKNALGYAMSGYCIYKWVGLQLIVCHGVGAVTCGWCQVSQGTR